MDRLLQHANALLPEASGMAPVPKAWIVPHAGYRFSGAIAASAYARVQFGAQTLRRVVLLGPSHRVGIPGIAVPSVSAFDTPLGSVPLDQDNVQALLSLPCCVAADEPHAKEHSLEVQLPFLQKVLPEFQLTPVAIGAASRDQVAAALKQVWGGPETLILISSDLSHYHAYEEAQRLDEQSSRAIMSLAPGRIRSRDACGWRGVNGLLQQASDLGLTPSTLNVLSSGDTTGRRDRVVGYGAWTFSADAVTVDKGITEADETQLLELARKSIACAVAGKPVPRVAVGTFAAALQRPGATFVTLTKGGRLRACLGSLRAFRPLVLDLVERSHSTAGKDARFPPIRRDEVADLHMEIAILTAPTELHFKSAGDLLEQLLPGTDGLTIEDQGHRATFLPKVWSEISDPARFLARLRQKAGLSQDHWSATIRAWKYQTRSFGTALHTRNRAITPPVKLD
ncbi:MAG: hypothetical protein A3H91_00720 [Gammaproteobacteria bacterium RIFCSPLOWO2_02_FULL_61_13]|nr:MAG: hypothetical protein A3H91_00720 [Gammaproteobacteria bacterium RIFCSPLOWO2_02_FULL_61_13]